MAFLMFRAARRLHPAVRPGRAGRRAAISERPRRLPGDAAAAAVEGPAVRQPAASPAGRPARPARLISHGTSGRPAPERGLNLIAMATDFTEETAADAVIESFGAGHRPAAARDPRRAGPAPARVRPRRRADHPRVGEGDRLPHQDGAEERRRAAGVHPAVGRPRAVDAGRDDLQPEVRRRDRVDRARPVPRGGVAGPRARRQHRPGRHRHAVRGHRPGRLGGRHPAARRHPRRVAGQRPGLLRRAAARRAAARRTAAACSPPTEKGEFWFRTIVPSYYPIPTDGPVGELLHRDGQARVPPGAHPLHRDRARPPRPDHAHLRGGQRVHRVRHRLRGEEVPGRRLRRGHRPGAGAEVERRQVPFRHADFDIVMQPGA